MPSIVKTNSRLATGAMQLVSYSFDTQIDNTLSISAQFICLPNFADGNMASLRTGAPAPAVLMANSEILRLLQSLRASSTPTIRSASAQTIYGLTTINVVLGVGIPAAFAPDSPNNDSGDTGGGGNAGSSPIIDPTTGQPTNEEAAKANYEITTSTDLRSFSGSVTRGTGDEEESIAFSFDYYATTVTVEGAGSAGRVSPSQPFNVRSGERINVGSLVSPFVATTSRIYRNSLGVMKTQTTSSAYYIQTRFSV